MGTVLFVWFFYLLACAIIKRKYNKNMPEYSQQELQKLFDILSPELKETILSEETAERISQICKRHKINEKNVPKIAKLVGNILMGLLPPEELPETLEIKLGIDREKTQDISREINRFILFPVNKRLTEFYQEIKLAPGGRIERKEIEKKEKIEIPKRKRGKKLATDIYRELIEE